ncbi:MAG: MaoC family dehydratase [Actinomycetia bacterium]|nr:MaoC family dehydratase [Actinomycetes bacterium]MCP4227503.1 MaoC family dehydratase [Actinomycetes bacterium]MCP5035821.1 MaoC family dehydratase [Actinomycetes bacterium]
MAETVSPSISVPVGSVLSDTPMTITGPVRAPKQMLAEQVYDDHLSVHDDETAAKLGLIGAPIEGPTHFSQFEPILASLWGDRWFSHGCLSAHFLNMVVEGEEVQATVTVPGPGSNQVRIDAAKADGTPVLTGTASVGPEHPPTELLPRIERAQANTPSSLVILDQLSVGQKGLVSEVVSTGPDVQYGDLYPFSLRQKLTSITESLTWHDPDAGTASPWGRAVVPIEMLTVLANAGGPNSGFRVRQPSVGLFIDLEVRLLGTPILIDNQYRVDREIIALAESRRTESYWVRNLLVDVETGVASAEVLLHSGVFKDSYPDYPKD